MVWPVFESRVYVCAPYLASARNDVQYMTAAGHRTALVIMRTSSYQIKLNALASRHGSLQYAKVPLGWCFTAFVCPNSAAYRVLVLK